MAQPVSPVIPGLEPYEIVFGPNQPDVIPLPALRGSAPTYSVISRWRFTEEERQAIAQGADIFIIQETFGHSFQPTGIGGVPLPGEVTQDQLDSVKETFGLDDELTERLAKLFS